MLELPPNQISSIDRSILYCGLTFLKSPIYLHVHRMMYEQLARPAGCGLVAS
jgi:hypothetical protein